MKRHEEIERILAGYRDATAEEQAAAKAHVNGCASCAARYEAYAKVDAAVGGLGQPALPARLSRPFAALLTDARSPSEAQTRPGLTLRAFAPAGLVLLIVAALSMVVWSVSSVKPQLTTTPTLTMTLTPTTTATLETEPASYLQLGPVAGHPLAGYQVVSREMVGVIVYPGDSEPTPAPIPAPVAAHSPAASGPPVLLVGHVARAKITN